MTSFRPFALCLLLFSLAPVLVVKSVNGRYFKSIRKGPDHSRSKALEPYRPNYGFLRDEEQQMIQGRAIGDAEISATAMQIWNSVKDLNVQYDGQARRKEPLRLFTKGQRGLRLDPFFTGLFHFFNAHQGVVDPCVRTSSCKDAQKRFVENISPRINGPIWILHGFLSAKGLFKGDFKAFKESLQKLWFEPFNRSGGTVLDSSAFEHVFLGEITKKGDVTGLHNWMRMYDDELGGRFNLTENAKYYPTGKPFISDVKFTWNGYTKKQGTTFFMKKSPAVEIALYTLCFNVRRNISCPTISFGAGVVKVMAKPLAGNKNLISAAYPEFP